MSLGKVPKRRWHQARHEQRAEHAGIHGNPESGNHPGTVTPHILTMTIRREGGGGGEGAKARHDQTARPHTAGKHHTSTPQNPM